MNVKSGLSVLFTFFSLSLFSQDAEFFRPDSVRKVIEAVQINTTLKIDGILNEPEWNLVKPSSRFVQIEPEQGKPSKFQTDVRILFNKQYLYVGVFAQDSMGKKAIMATDFLRDFDYLRHDLLTLSFDGFNDKRNAMAFATNAYGVQRDLLSFDDLYYDIDWDGLWRVRTNRTDSGWYAEIALPWQTLRYPKTKTDTQNWGFNIYRNRRLTNEISAFSPFPRIVSSLRMDYAGELRNLKPPPPKPNIRVVPYFLTSYDHYQNYGPDVKPELTQVKVGADAKWAINPNAVLDLTVNTDFAQADADLQVNNVTQFNVFFPEKRQFFLENASLFGFGIAQNPDGSLGSMRIQPFFSRSIGLDTSGNPIPLIGGGRFVYRSDKLNYGLMAIRQADSGATPATNFFVGRITENFGRQSRIGALFSVKNDTNSTNYQTTIDGFFRLGKSQSINTILVNSITTGTHTHGFAGFVQYLNATNHYKIWWTESIVTKNFDPEMGFVSRYDVIGTTPGINYFYRGSRLPFKKWIRAYEPGFQPELYYQASTGKFIELDLPFWPIWINFQSGAWFGYSITPSIQHLTYTFVPLGVVIAPGDYNFTRQEFWIQTNPSKILNLSWDFKWGGYYNGKLTTSDIKLQFAPVPQISLVAGWNSNHFKGVGESDTTTVVDLFSLQGRLALNPRVQLTGLFQKNSLDNSITYNIRFSWEYQPLSYIYLIFNHGSMEGLQQQKQVDGHLIAKISYLKQF